MSEKSSTSPEDSGQNDSDTESIDLPSIDPRKDGTPTDFTINVEDESFNVHRDIIVAKSEYFKAMLTHDTKENQQGFVDMKDVNPDVVRECIEFMYTGHDNEVSVDIENVGDVLQAAGIIQLNEIRDLCSIVLECELNSKIWVIEILILVTKFDLTDLQDNAQEVFVETYKLDSVAEMVELSKSNFIEYLPKNHSVDFVIAWDCIKRWIEYDPDNRSDLLFELLSLLDWDEFPPYTFLRSLWINSRFKQSQQCLDLVYENVIMDVQGFEKKLSIESFFLLKEMSGKFKFIPKQIKKLLLTFLNTNVVKLLTKSEFKDLTEAEIMVLLSDPSIDDLTGEKWKWMAVETWVKHASNRRVFLPNLLKQIKFQNLPKSFLKGILKHSLIKETLECHQIISDLITTDKPSVKTHHLTVLYSNGEIRDFNISTKEWNIIPAVSIDSVAQVFTFNNKLCILTGRKLFYMTESGKWIEKASVGEKIGDSAKVVTTNDHIYVIETLGMSCYDSEIDSWTEDLPGVGFSSFSAASAHEFIYVTGEKQMKLFYKTWSSPSIISTNSYSLATSLPDCLFFTYDNSRIVQKYSVISENWTSLPKTPKQIYSMFTISDTSIAIRTYDDIYVYDDLCGVWNSLRLTIPTLYQNTTSDSNATDIISVCSYYTN